MIDLSTMFEAMASQMGQTSACTYWHRSDGSTEQTHALFTELGSDPQSGAWKATTAIAFVPALTGPDPEDGDRLTVDGEEWTVGAPQGADRETVNRRGLGAAWRLYVTRARRLKS